MKPIYLFITSLVLASACNYRETHMSNRETQIRDFVRKGKPAYLVFGDEDQLEIISTNDKGFTDVLNTPHPNKYLIPFDGECLNLNTFKGSSIPPRKTIRAELYIEGSADSLNIDSSMVYIDKVLSGMYSGYKIEIVKRNKIDCSKLRSSGEINADNIKNHFIQDARFSRNLDLHIYMVQKGDFLANVNALCIALKESNLILGDIYLLNNPVLFVHELMHSLDLRHLELRTCNDIQKSGANVMDYKTKGCSHYLTARQILLANFKEYIPPIKNDINFPNCIPCENYNGDNLIFEDFANSVEGAAIELPINGDHEVFKEYIDETQSGYIPGNKRSVIYNNYKSQAIAFGILDVNFYANQMIAIHRKIRQNNLARWAICNYQKKFGVDSLYGKILRLDSLQMSDYLSSIGTIPKPNTGSSTIPDTLSGKVRR